MKVECDKQVCRDSKDWPKIQGKKLVSKVSLTFHTTSNMDKNTQTFACNVELDFKYPVGQYFDAFPSELLAEKGQKIFAGDVRMPYYFPNATDVTVNAETHLFKYVSEEPGKFSMYGGPNDCASYILADPFLKTEKQRKTKDSSSACLPLVDGRQVFKIEKYCMNLVLTYVTNPIYDPFDDIYLFVKIATTGKPGTECTYFYFDENDCGFSGLERDIGSYSPLGKHQVTTVSFGHEYEGSYPRVYLSQRIYHHSFEDSIKFYLFPPLMCILMLAFPAGDRDNLLSLSGGYILADVALLFTAGDSDVMTRKERALIFNIIMLAIATLLVASKTYGGDLARQIMGVSIVSINLLMFVSDKCEAMLRNNKIAKAVENGNLKAIDAF
jgi:hypothetical protein